MVGSVGVRRRTSRRRRDGVRSAEPKALESGRRRDRWETLWSLTGSLEHGDHGLEAGICGLECNA